MLAALRATPGAVQVCLTAAIRLEWTVRYATEVRLIGPEGWVQQWPVPDPCAPWPGAVTHQLQQPVRGNLRYTLTVRSLAGAALTQEVTVNAASGYPRSGSSL
jgi:hypothetical protein